MELERELRYFESIKDDLLKRYDGKYVLIKGENLIDVFSSFEDAYKEGVKRFGNSPFLIKKVEKIEPIEEVPSLSLGVIHADI